MLTQHETKNYVHKIYPQQVFPSGNINLESTIATLKKNTIVTPWDFPAPDLPRGLLDRLRRGGEQRWLERGAWNEKGEDNEEEMYDVTGGAGGRR